jgi:hypothetical protein
MTAPIAMTRSGPSIHDILTACGYTHRKAPSCLAGFSGDHEILRGGEVIAIRDACSVFDWLLERGDIVESE